MTGLRTTSNRAHDARALRTTTLGLLAATVLGGCSGVTYTTSGHPPVLAAQERTFALLEPEAAPSGFHATPATPAIWAQIAPIARARFVGLGYVERAPEEARLLVRFGMGIRQHEAEGAGGGPRSEAGEEFPAYTDAALILDVTDRSVTRRVWRGGARTEITAGRVDSNRLREAVDGLVDRFANASRAPSQP